MDFCPGGDLSKLLLKRKKFDEHRAKLYICEVLSALEHLHKNDIIYRDLKPENVVIDEDGHACLTDFGLSKEGISDNYGA
jgi:serine/threonine protein kinase